MKRNKYIEYALIMICAIVLSYFFRSSGKVKSEVNKGEVENLTSTEIKSTYKNEPKINEKEKDRQVVDNISKETRKYEIPKLSFESISREEFYKGKSTKIEQARLETIIISNNDEDLLSRLIMSESGIEPYEGKLAVGSVVVNRSIQAKRPLKDIIFEPHQFDGVQTKWFEVEPNEESKRAAKEVLKGINNMPDGTAFLDRDYILSQPGWVIPDWADESHFIKRIGNHWFYNYPYTPSFR